MVYVEDRFKTKNQNECVHGYKACTFVIVANFLAINYHEDIIDPVKDLPLKKMWQVVNWCEKGQKELK